MSHECNNVGLASEKLINVIHYVNGTPKTQTTESNKFWKSIGKIDHSFMINTLNLWGIEGESEPKKGHL